MLTYVIALLTNNLLVISDILILNKTNKYMHSFFSLKIYSNVKFIIWEASKKYKTFAASIHWEKYLLEITKYLVAYIETNIFVDRTKNLFF